MYSGYYNFQSKIAESWLDRLSFVWNWWRIYSHDPYWVPPCYPSFRRELETRHNPHLARLDPAFVTVEALPRSRPSGRQSSDDGSAGPGIPGSNFEQPVAAAGILKDNRRRDGSAYLSLLHCANDPECLERLLSSASEMILESRSPTLIGPVGISPYLESGLLLDSWDRVPPLHTAYNPPYLPEIIGSTAVPVRQSRLYELEIPREPPSIVQSPVEIQPLIPSSLGEELLPLFSGCLKDVEDGPPVDAKEAAFLLRWISSWPLVAWTALLDAQAVGFVILGPDLAPQLKRARGGRNPFRQAWLRLASRFRVWQGRLFFGGVLPHWRRRGIGRQLLNRALITAQDNGWEKITIGPVREDSEAASFLKRAGARACQSYQIYRWEL